MKSPYSNITISYIVEMSPDKLNNNLSFNIKEELKKNILGKCLNDYGYIVLIHKLEKFNMGIVREDIEDAIVNFNVSFTCRICRPLKDMIIGCRIDTFNQNLMKLSNGPIIIVIQNEHVDSNQFRFDPVHNTMKHNQSGQLLKVGDYVKVLIYQTRFTYKDTKIFAIGQLLNVLNKEEIDQYNTDLVMNKEDHYFE